MSALIGALRVSLSAETTAFEAGMKRSQRQAQTTATSIERSFRNTGNALKAGVAGFVAGLSATAIAQGLRAALDYAGSLGELAQQLGVTTRDLQVFQFAAGQVGVSQEQLQVGLQKLTITLGKVAAGAEAPAKAFKAIGISVDSLRGKDTGEAFRMIADGLSKVTDRSQRAAVEVALFGKSGASLDTLLAGGSGALNELSSAAERLGIVLSDEQIQNADRTADKLDAMKTVISAQIAGVVADNADSIVSLANALASLTGEVLRFLNSNPTSALAILGAMAGGVAGGLPGAAIGGFAGAMAGTGMQTRSADANNDLAFRSKAMRDAQARYHALRDNKSGGGLVSLRRSDAKSANTLKEAAAEFQRQTQLLERAAAAKRGPATVVGTGTAIGNFLAPEGGGHKSGGKSAEQLAREAERKRLEALRNSFRVDEDQRRADMDILQAKRQLATDTDKRAAISLQIIDAEKQSFEAALAYDVAAGDKSEAEAEILRGKYAEKDALDRQLVLREAEEQRQQDAARLAQVDYDIQRQALDAESRLAETASERRAVEMRILDLAYREERERLERIIRESDNAAEIDEAQRRLAALAGQYAIDRRIVEASTRGPLEDYMAGLPLTADKWAEALEGVAVNGISAIEDGFVSAASKIEVFGGKLKGLNPIIQSLIGQLAQLAFQKYIIGGVFNALGIGSSLGGMFSGGGMDFGGGFSLSPAISNTWSSVPHFAGGGALSILGRKGRDQNLLSLNGLPLARVNYGEKLSISNGGRGDPGAGARVLIMPSAYFDATVDGRAAAVAAPMAGQAAVMGAAGSEAHRFRRQRRYIP